MSNIEKCLILIADKLDAITERLDRDEVKRGQDYERLRIQIHNARTDLHDINTVLGQQTKALESVNSFAKKLAENFPPEERPTLKPFPIPLRKPNRETR